MTRAAEIAKIIGKGSVAIHGEAGTTSSGSTGLTTNLQQGLAKSWVNYDAQDQNVDGSFNQSSLSDLSAGRFDSTYTNNLSGASNKCIQVSVWNTQNEGSSEFAGSERGHHGGHQGGDEAQQTSKIRFNTRIGAQSAANGADTDFDASYCTTVGDLA